MDSLLRSFDSFSARHANTAFFKAINPEAAARVLETSSFAAAQLDGPHHFTTSFEHAAHYVPHHPVVEFKIGRAHV